MEIDKRVIKALENYKSGSKRRHKLQDRLDKYNRLIEKGYIKKQTYSLSRLDSIGYSYYTKHI